MFLKGFLLASLGALALRQFAVEQFHADTMTGPMKLRLHQNGVDAGKRSLCKNFGMRFCHVMPRIFLRQVV